MRLSACLPSRPELVLLGLTLIAVSCVTPPGEGRPVIEDRFTGLGYPAWEGDLPSPGRHGPVWLIGIDGASWDLIRPLIDEGELPNFAALMERGAHGTLRSEQPTLSPSLWTTIITGVPRHVHGIVNFVVRVPGSHDVVEAGPPDRLTRAVWEHVGSQGGSSTVVSWFGSYPAEAISGAYVSKGFDPENPAAGQVHPPELADRLKRETLVRMPGAALRQIGRTEFLRKRLVEDARTMAILDVLAAGERSDFVVAYFSGIDVAQHVTWRHMDPSYEPFPGEGPRDAALADVIPGYYRYADHLLGRVISLAPEEATILILSDHGGGPLEPERAYHFQLEVLLRILGYMKPADPEAETTAWSETTVFAISELYRDRKRIWLNLEGVEAEGTVPPAEAPALARRVRDRLRQLETDDGSPVFDLLEVHADDPGWSPGDAALTVRFSRDALLTKTVKDDGRALDFSPVRLRHGDVSGAHRLDGIILMRGPAIKAGPLSRPANLYQIAPTLLYLLGMPQDGEMLAHAPSDGGVLEEVFRPEVLASDPIRMVDAYPFAGSREGRARAGVALESDPALDEAMEKLRALGYIR